MSTFTPSTHAVMAQECFDVADDGVFLGIVRCRDVRERQTASSEWYAFADLEADPIGRFASKEEAAAALAARVP